jgi:hypothetical protein
MRSRLATAAYGFALGLVFVSCTPEQTPASAARTAAALRSDNAPSTLTPAGTRAQPAPTPGPVTLNASPNPPQFGAGGLGTTTISWSTGSPDSGDVYVSEDGRPERLFASGSSGSQEAPWIRPVGRYEFKLYVGGNTQTRASLTIGSAGGEEPQLTAQPNPVPADDQELGTTTIHWTTNGPDGGEIYVIENGGPERLFAAGTEGTAPAAWICRGSTYEFHLYAGSGHSNQLGSVTATRAPDAPGHEPPPRERCRS